MRSKFFYSLLAEVSQQNITEQFFVDGRGVAKENHSTALVNIILLCMCPNLSNDLGIHLPWWRIYPLLNRNIVVDNHDSGALVRPVQILFLFSGKLKFRKL